MIVAVSGKQLFELLIFNNTIYVNLPIPHC